MGKITIDGIEVEKQDYDAVDSIIRDAGESAFFLRELEYKKRKSYDTKQRILKAISLLPVSTEADAGAETITYQTFTEIALGKIISDYAEDVPRAEIYGTETSAKVYTIGTSFGYSRQEIRRSHVAGRSLDSRRSKAAKTGSDQKLDSIAWTGDTAHNISGFLTYPGITQYVNPNGAAGTATWATKTPDEIVKDVSGLINAVANTTNGNHMPDTLILPLTQYLDIAQRRMTDGNTMTVLQYVKTNFPMIKTIDWLDRLSTAGTGAVTRALIYSKDPDSVTLEIPMPYSQLPPQVKGYGFEILTEQRTAGVIVYYPLSIAYMDAI